MMRDPNEQADPRSDLADRIGSFLAAHHVMSLATSGPDGSHAVNLFYACDGLALIWMSDPSTRHSREVEADSRVAATVAPDYTSFADIRGVQISGRARQVAEGDRALQLRRLEARYPFLQRLADGPAELRAAYARTAVYRLDPARIVLIDNTKGFGHKEILELGQDRGGGVSAGTPC